MAGLLTTTMQQAFILLLLRFNAAVSGYCQPRRAT